MPRTIRCILLAVLAALLGPSPAAGNADSVGPSAFLRLLDGPGGDAADSLPLPPDSYRVADGISAPEVIQKTGTEYPAEARQIGLEGTAMVAAIIGDEKTTVFPHGAGISNDSLDEGQLVVASGRLAIVKLSFDVDKTGAPVGFKVEQASEPLWGKEAIAVIDDR